MKLADITYTELREAAPNIACALIPMGCTEQQSLHLPCDFDSFFVTRICEAIDAELRDSHGVDVLLIPTSPFGPTPEHVGFGHGYINLRQSTHEAVAEDILHSLHAQGIEPLLLMRGCGQHDLSGVVDRFNQRLGRPVAHQPVVDFKSIADDVLGAHVPGGHADSFTTSVSLYLRPNSVRADQIQRPENEPFTWGPDMDFYAISDTGTIGDPTRASMDAGEELFRRVVAEGAETVLKILAGKGGEVRQVWNFDESD